MVKPLPSPSQVPIAGVGGRTTQPYAEWFADLEQRLRAVAAQIAALESVAAVTSVLGSQADLAAATIDDSVTVVVTLYGTTPGDRARLWKFAASEPAHANKEQSADGKWWELTQIFVAADWNGAPSGLTNKVIMAAGEDIRGQLGNLTIGSLTLSTGASGNEDIEYMGLRNVRSGRGITYGLPVATGVTITNPSTETNATGTLDSASIEEQSVLTAGNDGGMQIGGRDGRFDELVQIMRRMARFNLEYAAVEFGKLAYQTAPYDVTAAQVEDTWKGVSVDASGVYNTDYFIHASPTTDHLEFKTNQTGDGIIVELPKYRCLRDQLRVMQITVTFPVMGAAKDSIDFRFGLWKGKASGTAEMIGVRRLGFNNFDWRVAKAAMTTVNRDAGFGKGTNRWRIRLNSIANGGTNPLLTNYQRGGYRLYMANTSIAGGVYFAYANEDGDGLLPAGITSADEYIPFFQLKSTDGQMVTAHVDLFGAIRS